MRGRPISGGRWRRGVMSNRFSGFRGRVLIGCLAGTVATVIGMTGAGAVQAASGVRGSLKAFPISGTYQIQQLFAASDGQVTCRLKVLLQPASPSETVRVSETVPGAVQVSVGFCAVALLSVPEEVVQL